MTILDFLAENGVTIRRADTGAVELPNGRIAFVSERTLADGRTQTVVMQPSDRYSPEPRYQRFMSRDRALKAIRNHTR